QIQIQVEGLRHVGVEARGVITDPSIIQSCAGMDIYAFSDVPRFGMRWFRDRIAVSYLILAAIGWADVVHYHYGKAFALRRRVDAAFAGLLNKLRLVTCWGNDIRVPEIESRGNPYFAAAYPVLGKRLANPCESSHQVQEWYARHGFHCVLGSEAMLAHVDRSLFRDVHMVRGAVDVTNFHPVYPDAQRRKVVVVHAPSD